MRSFFGVLLLTKNPHAAMQHPAKKAAGSNAAIHRYDGGKKNTPEAIMLTIIVMRIRFFAVFRFLAINPPENNPVNIAAITIKTYL